MIISRQNRRLKDIRRLRRSKGDRALLEGPHLVAEALASGLALENVLAAPGFFEREGAGRELREILGALPEPPVEVAPELLAELADADSPKGLLAVARLPRAGAETLPLPAAGDAGGTYVYLEGLQDPGNLGAVARSAEAAGAAGLALSPGCAHPNHPRALRGSAGSLLRLPAAVGVEPGALDAHLGGRARWLALVPRGGEVLWRAELPEPLVLAVGAEGPGLSDALLHRCALRVTIPGDPRVESLNAAVAAALVLFEVRRRELAPDS